MQLAWHIVYCCTRTISITYRRCTGYLRMTRLIIIIVCNRIGVRCPLRGQCHRRIICRCNSAKVTTGGNCSTTAPTNCTGPPTKMMSCWRSINRTRRRITRFTVCATCGRWCCARRTATICNIGDIKRILNIMCIHSRTRSKIPCIVCTRRDHTGACICINCPTGKSVSRRSRAIPIAARLRRECHRLAKCCRRRIGRRRPSNRITITIDTTIPRQIIHVWLATVARIPIITCPCGRKCHSSRCGTQIFKIHRIRI